MEEIRYIKEMKEYLNIPSCPKKEWDGKSHFDKGVAVISLTVSGVAYAVCSYSEKDNKPHITKVFCLEPFTDIKKIYPVPAYLDTNVDKMDFDDDDSKEAMRDLIDASQTINGEGTEKKIDIKYEWIFPEIHSAEEAIAFIKSKGGKYSKGALPKSEDKLKARLLLIQMDEKK